jgi:hypothetical protein
MLSDAELARLSYQTNEKLWARMSIRTDGPMLEAVHRLAAIDHRNLQDQLRHLVAIGIQLEEKRLAREAEFADAITEEIEKSHRKTVRQTLKKVRNGEKV